MKNPIHYFRSGYRRIERFKAWFPILWHDEDWEPEYLFKIMRFKISRMREQMDRNKIIMNYKKYVRQMKVAEELLHRFEFSDFYDKLNAEIESNEKAGKCKCPENIYRIGPVYSDINTRKPGPSYFKTIECGYCRKAGRRWMERDIAKQKEDFDFLFKHLKKHVKKWWD